jgi:ketosteroid isomerase-like protein
MNTIMESHRSPAKHGSARVALGLALLGALAACTSLRIPPAPTLSSEIEEQNRRLEELFRAGDLLGVADLYADDAMLIDERGRRTLGREEIDAFWSAIESPLEWRLEIRSLHGSEALAYELGTSYLTTRQNGERSESASHFLLLWRREPGGPWRIQLDAHWPLEKR